MRALARIFQLHEASCPCHFTWASCSKLLLLIPCLGFALLTYSCILNYCCPSTSNLSNNVKGKVVDGEKTYHNAKRRLPQCLIIGVRKGGTRALLEYLNLHPNVVAHKSEMHFFNDIQAYENGLEWYRSKMPFSFAEQITIEKTPAYFTDEEAAGRIFKMNRSIKLLLVFREPVARAISDYTQIYSNKQAKGLPWPKFGTLAIDMYGRVNKSYKAIERSMYYKHMDKWLHFFPLSSFHFIDGEQLVVDPASELKKVETFLGIPHELTEDKFYFNKTRGFYCMKNNGRENAVC